MDLLYAFYRPIWQCDTASVQCVEDYWVLPQTRHNRGFHQYLQTVYWLECWSIPSYPEEKFIYFYPFSCHILYLATLQTKMYGLFTYKDLYYGEWDLKTCAITGMAVKMQQATYQWQECWNKGSNTLVIVLLWHVSWDHVISIPYQYQSSRKYSIPITTML